ncbi:MAG: carboxypeptidase-like regulatory domain-containing protein [Myxococcota bacterium]
MLGWILMAGCLPETPPTLISGRVVSSRVGGSPIAGATVVVRDQFGGVHAEATTDNVGLFEADMPREQVIYVEVSSTQHVPTTFTAVAGTESLRVEDGQLWLRSVSQREDLFNEFASCDAILEIEQGDTAVTKVPDEEEIMNGAVIEGEVRLFVAAGQDPDTLPAVTTARLQAVTGNGTIYPACYLDDLGSSDRTLERTGDTGRFAIFGVPNGVMTVESRYDYGAPTEQLDFVDVYVAEGGVVPLYPMYVSMPGN